MKSYSVFAQYYDELTENVEYSRRAEYLLELMRRLGHQPGLTLDLACGTGSLTLELYRRGVDIYGVDGSVAVSYTHLDVYKRQRQLYDCPGSPGVRPD